MATGAFGIGRRCLVLLDSVTYTIYVQLINMSLYLVLGVGGPAYSSDTKRRKTDSVVSCGDHFCERFLERNGS